MGVVVSGGTATSNSDERQSAIRASTTSTTIPAHTTAAAAAAIIPLHLVLSQDQCSGNGHSCSQRDSSVLCTLGNAGNGSPFARWLSDMSAFANRHVSVYHTRHWSARRLFRDNCRYARTSRQPILFSAPARLVAQSTTYSRRIAVYSCCRPGRFLWWYAGAASVQSGASICIDFVFLGLVCIFLSGCMQHHAIFHRRILSSFSVFLHVWAFLLLRQCLIGFSCRRRRNMGIKPCTIQTKTCRQSKWLPA